MLEMDGIWMNEGRGARATNRMEEGYWTTFHGVVCTRDR